MVKKHILFFLSTFQLIICAQVNNNYVNYNIHINKAELEITRENITLACKLYSKAKNLHYMFNSDLWNYAVCSAIIKDTNTTLSLVNEILKRNVDKDNILKEQVFYFLEKDIQNLDIKKVNFLIYRNRIDSLFKEDQKYRVYDSCYIKYNKEIKKIDSSNVACVKNMFNQFGGYIPESEIGFGESYFNEPLDIIIRHQAFGNKSTIYNFSSNINTAIEKGVIDFRRAIFLKSIVSGKAEYGQSVNLIKIVYSNGEMISKKGKELANNSNVRVMGYPKINKQQADLINYNRKKAWYWNYRGIYIKSIIFL